MQGLMQAGFGLYVGVNLTDSNEDQFNNNEPFTGDGGPDPANGHCVLWAYSETADGPHTVGTWAVWWPSEDSFIEQCLIQNPGGEAFLVVTTEEQAAKFTPQLLADVQALGGTVPDAAPAPPAPPPAPVPPKPVPTPPAPPPVPSVIDQWVADLKAHAAAVVAYAEEIEAWVDQHLG